VARPPTKTVLPEADTVSSAAMPAVEAGLQARRVPMPLDTAAALRREEPLTRAKSPEK
jgi:hypothetical protein